MYVVLLQTFNDLMEFLRSILKMWITNIYPLTINLTYIFWAISKIRYFQESSCDIFLKFQDLKVFVFDNVWTQHVSDIFSVAKQFISFFVAILSKCLDDHHYTRKHEKRNLHLYFLPLLLLKPSISQIKGFSGCFHKLFVSWGGPNKNT